MNASFKAAFLLVFLLSLSRCLSPSGDVAFLQTTATQINKPLGLDYETLNGQVIAPKKVCDEGLERAHHPFGNETKEMRFVSLIVFAVLSLSVMLMRTIFSLVSRFFSKFTRKTIRLISRYTFLYLLVISFVFVLFTLGVFDGLKFNIESLLFGLFVFSILFFVYTVILVLSFSNFIGEAEQLDENPAYFSFKNIKTYYEKTIYKKFSYNEEESEFIVNKEKNMIENKIQAIFRMYELLVLKSFFIVPFFPVFKPSILNEDFKFGLYLQINLKNQVKKFYSFSLTCLLVTSMFVLLWSAVIEPSKINVSLNIKN